MKKEVFWRVILHADSKAIAEELAAEFVRSIDPNMKTLHALSPYEDNEHFEINFESHLEGKSNKQLNREAFNLCMRLADGPWLFHLYTLKNKTKQPYIFEALYRPEAFINPAPTYQNCG